MSKTEMVKRDLHCTDCSNPNYFDEDMELGQAFEVRYCSECKEATEHEAELI